MWFFVNVLIVQFLIISGSSSGRTPMSSLSNVPIIATAVDNSTPVGAVMSHTPESRTDCANTGVIVSPSLPPVPGKVIEKIKNNQFVDLRELMPDNIALAKLLSQVGAPNIVQSGTRMREIEDPLTWCFYFLALAVSIEEKKARDLATYGQLVIYLAQRHGGRGWISYDRLFHQKIASGSSLAWNEFAPSLMASTVLSSGSPRSTCQLCNGADHITFGCALFRTTSANKSFSSILDSQSKKMKIAEPCKRFNRGACNQTCMSARNVEQLHIQQSIAAARGVSWILPLARPLSHNRYETRR